MHSYAFYNGHLSETERRLSSLDTPESASMAAAVRYPSPPTRIPGVDAPSERKEDEHKESLSSLRRDLATELTSPLGNVTYPHNLSLRNYVDYIFCPTLCYEIEYPRTKGIRWIEVFFKTLAVFGCIFLLTLTSEEFIVPVLDESALRLQHVDTVSDKALILSETISMLLFPFTVTLLLVFLVIFEYVLGAFAELTCFADRHFYSDWWNSCDW
jgi:sterol O-acyltransferase